MKISPDSDLKCDNRHGSSAKTLEDFEVWNWMELEVACEAGNPVNLPRLREPSNCWYTGKLTGSCSRSKFRWFNDVQCPGVPTFPTAYVPSLALSNDAERRLCHLLRIHSSARASGNHSEACTHHNQFPRSPDCEISKISTSENIRTEEKRSGNLSGFSLPGPPPVLPRHW